MKKKDKKTIMIIAIIILAIILFSGTLEPRFYLLSTTPLTEEEYDSQLQCRIVIDGDVCDSYTDCQFLSDRDVSCIKGYELVKDFDTPEPSIENSQELSGGASNE